jgi:hypothetical protein
MTTAAESDAIVVVLGDEDEPHVQETVAAARANAPAATPVRVGRAEIDASRADVVLLTPGFRLEGGTIAALAAAAYSETTVATASAHNASVVAPPPAALPRRLARAGDGCIYVRRTALDLVGSELLHDTDAFARRCLRQGFVHVSADDWVEYGGAPPDDDEEPAEALSITVDARCLEHPLTGTQVHVLELLGALARRRELHVRALVPDRLDAGAERALAAIGTLDRIVPRDVGAVPRTDVAHRPYQVFAPDDVALLRRLGRRAVVTHQDLIAYANAAYFVSDEDWNDYRLLTRRALDAADAVVFFSAFTAREAAAEELVEDGMVVHVGTDHRVTGRADPAPPAAVADGPFIACLGTDFVHKNRLFALRLVEELVRRDRWPGRLVLAGPRMPPAVSSAEDEAAFLAARPALARRVVELGAVTEAEKAWLLAHARLTLYPSVVEGFGLIPFESAAAGTPCVFAAQAALAETMPPELARIVPWDPVATAERAAVLLEDDQSRRDLVDGVSAAGAGLTWDATAAGIARVYRHVRDAPAKPNVAVPRPSVGATMRRRARSIRARFR